MNENVLADALQVARVSEAYFGRFENRGPWAVEVGAHEMICVYAVLEGACVLEMPESKPLALEVGDMAVLLTPRSHALRSRQLAPRVDPEAILTTSGTAESKWPDGTGHESAGVRLVSGRLRCEWAENSHWWKLVPPVVKMRDQAHALPWLEATLHFIVEEVRASRPGSQTLARRLTELLFVKLLSGHLETDERTAPGWLTALGDPQIGKALALLHAEPEKPWTVARLAGELGMSRSAFANHFVRLVGEPPVHYLARLRMEKAAALLRQGWATTAEVAARVGYVSDASFCKAFKRAYAQSPGAYRRNWKATPRERSAPERAGAPRDAPSSLSGEAA